MPEMPPELMKRMIGGALNAMVVGKVKPSTTHLALSWLKAGECGWLLPDDTVIGRAVYTLIREALNSQLSIAEDRSVKLIGLRNQGIISGDA